MTDLAAHVVDRVMPRVPVRQWVLRLPHAFRYRLAYDHERMVAVFGLFVRAVLGLYARRARARGVSGAQTGAMTFVQRFGSAANLHVHAHVLVMDGVFTATEDGGVVFHKLPAPSDRELSALLALVRSRVLRHLRRHGWLDGPDGDADKMADDSAALAASPRFERSVLLGDLGIAGQKVSELVPHPREHAKLGRQCVFFSNARHDQELRERAQSCALAVILSTEAVPEGQELIHARLPC